MMGAKAFVAAFGVVSVNAQCENRTHIHALPASDLSVDLMGQVWITDTAGDQVYKCPAHDETCASCPDYATCFSMGSGWNRPRAIAVSTAVHEAAPVVYVSEDSKVKQCEESNGVFSCRDFLHWSEATSIAQLAVDSAGNVFLGGEFGDVLKCTPGAQCGMFVDSYDVLYTPPSGLAADSQGNVYIASGPGDWTSLKKCDPSGHTHCSTLLTSSLDGFSGNSSIAVGKDDDVYICDSGLQTLTRCSSHEECENLGAFECDGSIGIDENNFLFLAGADGLSRYCLSPSMKAIQI